MPLSGLPGCRNKIPNMYLPHRGYPKAIRIKLCKRSNDETYKNGTNITKEMIEAKKAEVVMAHFWVVMTLKSQIAFQSRQHSKDK
jgi:hypothetical protein